MTNRAGRSQKVGAAVQGKALESCPQSRKRMGDLDNANHSKFEPPTSTNRHDSVKVKARDFAVTQRAAKTRRGKRTVRTTSETGPGGSDQSRPNVHYCGLTEHKKRLETHGNGLSDEVAVCGDVQGLTPRWGAVPSSRRQRERRRSFRVDTTAVGRL